MNNNITLNDVKHYLKSTANPEDIKEVEAMLTTRLTKTNAMRHLSDAILDVFKAWGIQHPAPGRIYPAFCDILNIRLEEERTISNSNSRKYNSSQCNPMAVTDPLRKYIYKEATHLHCDDD